MAAPPDEVAGRQFHGRVDFLPRLVHETADVAAGHVAFDGDATLGGVAADLRRAVHEGNVRQLTQRHPRAGGSLHPEPLDPLNVLPLRFREAHQNAKRLLAFEDARRFSAANGGVDQIIDVGHIDPVPGNARSVDVDLQIRQTADALDVDVRRPGNFAENAGRLLGFLFEHIEVVTDNLDGDGGFHAADKFVDAVLNGLRHVESGAR